MGLSIAQSQRAAILRLFETLPYIHRLPKGVVYVSRVAICPNVLI